jgi:spore coat protein A
MRIRSEVLLYSCALFLLASETEAKEHVHRRRQLFKVDHDKELPKAADLDMETAFLERFLESDVMLLSMSMPPLVDADSDGVMTDDSGAEGGGDEGGDGTSEETDAGVEGAQGEAAARSGALIPGLIETNLQPLFVEEVPNALDPNFLYTFDEEKSITVEICKADDHVSGLIDPTTGEKLINSIYGYGQEGRVCTWPGMTFLAQANEMYRVLWHNKIPKEDYLLTNVDGVSVVDTSLHWAYALENYKEFTIATDGLPVVPHLHGGHNDFQFDGNPEFFFGPDWDIKGPQWTDMVYEYQDDVAGLLWYHDHSLGITRLNVHAGMAGFYVVRDEYDTGTVDNPLGLPVFPYELIYAIQDRMFKADGSLFYPAFPGDPFYEDFIDDEGAELPPEKFPNGGATALAEFFGDVMVVNGKVWPKTSVEPRQYRIRLLNGCDSRFLIFQFHKVALDATSVEPDSQPLPFTLIGADHGLGWQAMTMQELLSEPGSRYDLILDFGSADLEGHRIILWNIGPDEPFSGDADDFGFAKPGPGFSRTNRIMAFDVVLPLDETVPDTFDADSAIGQRYYEDIPEPDRVRKLGLFEGLDEYGRLQPLLGTVELATDAEGEPIFWPDTPGHVQAGLAGKQMEGTYQKDAKV